MYIVIFKCYFSNHALVVVKIFCCKNIHNISFSSKIVPFLFAGLYKQAVPFNITASSMLRNKMKGKHDNPPITPLVEQNKWRFNMLCVHEHEKQIHLPHKVFNSLICTICWLIMFMPYFVYYTVTVFVTSLKHNTELVHDIHI